MLKTIRAAFVYFAIVLGTGFALGVVRSISRPTHRKRWAELMEMPRFAAPIFFASGYILRRFPEIQLRGRALVVGLLALALAICVELGLAVFLQSQTLAEYLRKRDKASGCVYLGILATFALMPRLRLLHK